MKTILSGMRPTGKLHLGNLFGALSNWIKLSNEGNRCYFFIADLHALTTGLSKSGNIAKSSVEMVRDWIAFGLDPQKATFFIQSEVPAHSELTVLLSMMTPLGWLQRNPAYKEQIANLKDKDTNNFGFLGYPVLMSSDILLYDADYVPVGTDQLPHLEITRWIARKFNNLYQKKILTEPQPLLTSVPKILGTDGRKMSKSYNNAIYLSDSSEETGKKIMKSYTDPQRKRRSDPGRPEICPIFTLHKIFTETAQQNDIAASCRSAAIGCVECKKILIEHLNDRMSFYRKRRLGITDQNIFDILKEGTNISREKANQTLGRVKDEIFGKSSFFD